MRRPITLAAALALSACADREPAAAPVPEERCPEPFASTTNPLDAELSIRLKSDCLIAIEEEPAVLCRRLIADLLGSIPTEEEIATRCLGRNLDDAVRDLQQDPRYLLVSERIWAEALFPRDELVEAERILDFYTDVRALHRSEISYRELAIRVLMRPDFISVPVYGFLGLINTSEQHADFERLVAMYEQTLVPDRELPFLRVLRVTIDPKKCRAIGGCETSMFGGAAIELSGTATIALADATPELLAKLRVPGELIANTPRFYEYAAERLLNRFFDWDEGEAFPRTPGTLLPRLRQRLADELAKDGDYPRAERLVLTSWLYRQRARTLDADRPVWAVGPVKRARAETWLDSATRFAGAELGTCDHRYRTHYYFTEIALHAAALRLSYEEAGALMIRAHERLESLVPLVRLGSPALSPDYRYTVLAQSFGGCGALMSSSLELAHEAAVGTLCAELRPPIAGPATLDDVVQKTMRETLGRAANPTELEILREAIVECVEPECSRSVCRALLGAAEYLYY